VLPQNVIELRIHLYTCVHELIMALSAGHDGRLAGQQFAAARASNRRLARPLPERETMPSGTAEPECRACPPETVPALRDAVSGADEAIPSPVARSTSTHDPPHPEATKIVARATLYPAVNGKATAGCLAGSPAVN
jgi:hypothetical protein